MKIFSDKTKSAEPLPKDTLHKWRLNLASHSYFKTKEFSHECEAKDVGVFLFKFRRHLCKGLCNGPISIY